MEVILREDVAKLGHAGEIVKVKDGYARNFLIPKSLAYVATPGFKRRHEAEQKARRDKIAFVQGEAEGLAATLSALELQFTAKSGDGDRLFGSITTADIAEKLAAAGHDIDKRHIELSEPIKMIGEVRVPIRLHPNVRPEIKVTVTKEE